MKRRKYLLILIGLLGMIQIHAQKSVAFKADNEAPQPQWIGAITDEDAHIPSNRDYVGTGMVNEGKTRLEGCGSIVKTKHLAEERNKTPG